MQKKKEMECSLIATYTVLTTIILEHISPPNGFVRRYNYLTLQIKKLGLRDEVAPSSTACKWESRDLNPGLWELKTILYCYVMLPFS